MVLLPSIIVFILLVTARGEFEALRDSIESRNDTQHKNNQSGDIYTNTWVVEITEGGKEMADMIAEQYGFINLGKLEVDYNIIL